MKKKRGVIISSFILATFVLWIYSYAQQADHDLIVTGQVVDLWGNPVDGAFIVLDTTSGGDVTYSTKSAKDGTFTLYDYFIPSMVTRRLYVTGPKPNGAVWLLLPPFSNTPPWFALRNTGKEITSKLNTRVDVGKIEAQLLYGRVKLFFRDHNEKPLIKDERAWQNVWIRIRDSYGNIIAETTVLSASKDKAIDFGNSAITIALPEGIWKIEASPYLEDLDLDKGVWIKSQDAVSVKANEPLVTLYLR